ncbi:hypothetical protein [Geopseudomonas aromaticivorans]
MIQKRMTDYLLHCGDTGEGLGVALIWLEPHFPLKEGAMVRRAGPAGQDLQLVGTGMEITLVGPAQECLDLARATRRLYVIHQPAGQAPQSHMLNWVD